MKRRKRTRTVEIDGSDGRAAATFKASAIEYVRNLPEWARYHLYTKPFYTIGSTIEPVSLVYLYDVANILQILALPGGSTVLDVACGPGWLSEFLYRFGYDVTGIDICEDLLEIARERIGALSYHPLDRPLDSIRFRKADIEEEFLDERFDAVILYDCLHHFVDAGAVLKHVRRMLGPGGKLLIKEGAMPEPGSEGERRILEAGREYGTLESPFDHDCLEELLHEAGFESVRSFVEVNGAFERGRSDLKRIRELFQMPCRVNFMVCQLEEADPSSPPWGASIRTIEWKQIVNEGKVEIDALLVLENAGTRTWRSDGTLNPDNVCLGVRVYDDSGRLVEEHLVRTPINREVLPGERTQVEVRYPISTVIPDAVEATLVFDMVLQGRFWFSDRSSEALERRVVFPR